MFTASVRSGYVPYLNIAYPIDVTNTGAATTTVAVSGNNSIFTNTSLRIDVGETKTVYVASSVNDVTITLIDNDTTINLDVTLIEHQSATQYSNPSYISVFQLPGGGNAIIPTLDNIDLLMRQGHYFIEDGQIKIWRPNTL